MENLFDIVIIGSGPGGYTAAIRAAQLGFKTAIIEKYSNLGGTCTNVGCIPSKTLLDSSENYHSVKTKFANQGIEVGALKLNFQRMFLRASEVVKQNVSGINYLMKKNKIEVIYGTASFVNNNELIVKGVDGSLNAVKSKYFIVATGSKPSTIAGVTIDKNRIITSTEALSLSAKPESIVIIGGGVIGVEMASIFARIGVKITIIEYAESLIPTMDRELGKELQKVLTKTGITVLVSQKVQSAKNNGESVTVKYLDSKNLEKEISAEYCLVAVGRKPYTEGLGLEHTKIELDSKGRIRTDKNLRTAEENIYAIGDVIEGAMLAHKAEEEGVLAVEVIHGEKPHINYNLIPGVVYTWPEVASVGYTEEQLKEKGIAYNKGKFPFSASGRARASGDTEGFSKVLTDPKYGEILGVHIIGARAADIIAQAVVSLEFEITDSALGKISYAHPTYSETLKDAYLIASGSGALNI
ncbi:dihydrolipoyl dehydrogenase [Dyadobacter sp. 3J3]|uniref:dihydrolipoyl dehydrogenase n=1 Tax=Dyadobacter sp. 3J3 TaxID=2606600 RepID=UPI00135BFCD5|nr:dihydrolipoyl dehydrogenase [Dyadobacter sp. 3J3]